MDADTEEDTMRIAVAANGNDLLSAVDDRFGRAPWFLIVDTETGDVEAIENDGSSQMSGAGPKAAQMIASREVDCLVAGHCGPNAFAALAAHGIEVVVAPKTSVADAIEEVKSGKLKPATQPDVKGRWS
jgi:predicted Fe-Mo cluster-binding NifX family protein